MVMISRIVRNSPRQISVLLTSPVGTPAESTCSQRIRSECSPSPCSTRQRQHLAIANIAAQAFRPGTASKADVFSHFPARLPFQLELNGANIVPRDNDHPPRALLR